jgi:hypothetical protein
MIYVVLVPEYNLSLDNRIEFIFSINFIKYHGFNKFKDTIISLYNMDVVSMNANFKMQVELIATIRESDVNQVGNYFTNKLKNKPIQYFNSFNYFNCFNCFNSHNMYSIYFKCNNLSMFSGELKDLKKEINTNYLKIFRIVNKLKIYLKKDYASQRKQYKNVEVNITVNIIESDNTQAEEEIFTIYNDYFISKDMPRVVSIK